MAGQGPLLRDPGPLRSGLYDEAYANLREKADDAAANEYNAALLKTTMVSLPDPVLPEKVLTSTTLPGIERKPIEGTPVFGSPEEFSKAQREASTLADTTPLGQFTPYRPGFKADTSLKASPASKAPEVLASAPSDWESAFPGYKPKPEPSPPASASKEPEILTSVRPNRDVNYREAIASIESRGSGSYKAVGPEHPELGRALGRYQIMEANVGPWSKEALGHELTPKQFLASPQSQDIIFDHVFGEYVKQFGSPEAAAQAWFAGPGGVGKTERKDVLGTSVGTYGKTFQKELDILNGKRR